MATIRREMEWYLVIINTTEHSSVRAERVRHERGISDAYGAEDSTVRARTQIGMAI